MIKHEQAWDNYWQSRAAHQAEDALVTVGVEAEDTLKAFWKAMFLPLPASTKLIDFACGAGSVLRHARASGVSDLTGVDVSKNAITSLENTIPDVKGCVSAVTEVPFEEGYFDMAVSQYGFEYAGENEDILRAAAEITRILAPNGKFTAIAHIRGGAIEQESKEVLQHIDIVTSVDFIDIAKMMLSNAQISQDAPSAENVKVLTDTLMQMQHAENEILTWSKTNGTTNSEFSKFIQYLVGSTREAFSHRLEVPLTDNLQWLDAMNAEISAYKNRMTSMTKAALSPEMARDICQVFVSAGYVMSDPRPFYLDKTDKAAAWILTTV